MTFAQPPSLISPLKYTGDQFADIAGVNNPRAPTVNDVNYPLFCLWRNSNKAAIMPDAEGDIWVLIKFVYNAGTQHVDAIWVKIATGSSPPSGGVLTLSDTAGTLVFPTGAGNIQLFGTAGQIDILSDPGSNRLVFSLPGGSNPIDQIMVQAATAPGVNPVNPTAAGLMTVNGNLVVAHGIPIETRSRALNTWNIEPQIASAVAATDVTQNGMLHANSAHFTVDANGFLSLIGGGLAVDSFTIDYQPITTYPPTPTGTVVPTAAGNVSVLGGNGVATEQRDVAPGNNEITVHSPKWIEITANQTAVNGFGFITNGAARIDLALPSIASSSVGQVFWVSGKSTLLWRITQAANQTIHYGILDTTTGVGGRLDSTSRYDTVCLVCMLNDGVNAEWNVVNNHGTLTVT